VIAAQYAVDRNPELSLDHQIKAMSIIHDMIFYDSGIGCLSKERLSGYEYSYDDSFIKKNCPIVSYPPVTEEKFNWFVIAILIALIVPIFWIYFKGGKKK